MNTHRRPVTRGCVAFLTAATVIASIAGGTVVASSAAAQPADTSNADASTTPPLDKVFNGFVVGAITGGDVATAPEVFEALADDDPFYDEPRLAGTERPGTVLKAKAVDLMFAGVKPADITAYKLMYVTTDNDGVTPAISTGIVMIPDDGQAVADKKVISYQEANDSVGAYCHPSTQWTGGDPLDGSSWSAIGPLALMFGKGYAVVMSDVGNNGDRRPHGVFAGKFAGQTQLDAVRAAMAAPTGLDPDAPISLFGIAGGGVGAGFAAEMQADYAPELNVKSTVLEGMVVDQRNFMRTSDGSIGSGFAFATLLGLEPKYPEMRVDEKLTPAGKAIADIYRTQCQTPAYFTAPFLPLGTLFKNGMSPADIPEFQKVFDDNRLGENAPRSKVLITSCAKDDSPMSLVPAADSKELADKYRAGGTDVSYVPTDCSLNKFFTDFYGWGTDLFGMQTLPWVDKTLAG